MGTTPIYNFPYPEPTDLVRDGAQNFEDLANAIDATVDTVESLIVPGGYELIDSSTATGVTFIDFTIPDTGVYRYFRLQTLGNIICAAGTQLQFLQVNGIFTGNTYRLTKFTGNGTFAALVSTRFLLNNNTTTVAFAFIADLTSSLSGNSTVHCHFQHYDLNQQNGTNDSIGYGFRGATAPLSSIRLTCQTNITTNQGIALLGIR